MPNFEEMLMMSFIINGVLLKLILKLYLALFTCIFAFGGAAVGAITGAIQGHTTETGLSRGFVIGALVGAVTGVQLMDLVLNGDPLRKMSAVETSISNDDFSDIFDIETSSGLSQDCIKRILPICNFNDTTCYSDTSCTVCLQKIKNGQVGRWLPKCKHIFHVECIDGWLMRHPSCPICRTHVS
ncbi:NEP1-interacting protein-like 1 isoform X2 [Salvia splendens]|uniref:NEP1-interacting protein-like 1 isoform X2 n=1 Tax=Salvia splendens TaxID=180675 RepID=UPI001C2551DC|nr:NEP1-interacting protein-like 1 isoform X2 [Salvia splendens]